MLTVCSGTVNWEMLTGYHKGQYRYIKDFVATKNSATKTNHHLTHDLHGTKENVCILLSFIAFECIECGVKC